MISSLGKNLVSLLGYSFTIVNALQWQEVEGSILMQVVLNQSLATYPSPSKSAWLLAISIFNTRFASLHHEVVGYCVA